MVEAERRRATVEAIATLPKKCSRVMTLTILFGYSASEVAEAIGVSRGAVEKQRARGWRRLRERFNPDSGKPDRVSILGDGGGEGTSYSMKCRIDVGPRSFPQRISHQGGEGCCVSLLLQASPSSWHYFP